MSDALVKNERHKLSDREHETKRRKAKDDEIEVIWRNEALARLTENF